MFELINRIGSELERTEMFIYAAAKESGFSRDDIKIEISEKAYNQLTKGQGISQNLPQTIFGINFEVKINLSQDFIIYVDSSVLHMEENK